MSETYWVIRLHEPIMVTRPNPTAHRTNQAVMDDSTASVDSYVDPEVTEPLACPKCGATTGLTAMGTWADAARVVCPVGHAWTPFDEHEHGDEYALEAGRGLMQELILAQGLAGEDPPTR